MKNGNTINNIVKVALSLILGGAILYWMYRGFDFQGMKQVLLHGMDWTWMLLSFPFGILAQAFRGWRWQQTLEPVGEKPRASVSVNSIFVSYAVSLLIPRVGEFARCGILRRWDGVSFPKALGTVVTERAIDSVLVMVMIVATLLSQFRVFQSFFRRTGTRVDEFLASFSSTGWLVTMICGIAVIILLWVLLRKMSIYNKVKDLFHGLWQGVVSVRYVKNVPLFIFYSVAIWAGSIAVIVPTPNGAGPWHFAVKTMLILYGVASTAALNFVLIVHSIQTLLVVVIGIYGWMALSFTKKRVSNKKETIISK